MTTAQVHCGQCGFEATVRASADAEGAVLLELESACPGLQRLAQELPRMDPFTDGGTFFTCSVYRAADACLKHVDCVVPSALVRAAHVEAGIALPHQAAIRIEKQ